MPALRDDPRIDSLFDRDRILSGGGSETLLLGHMVEALGKDASEEAICWWERAYDALENAVDEDEAIEAILNGDLDRAEEA